MKDTYLNTQSSLAMKGAGYYSAKTVGAKNAIDKTQKVIENALKTEVSTLFLLPPDIKLFINLEINQELKMGSFLLKKTVRLFSTNNFLIFDIF